MSSPIIINAMTGGAQETGEINRELAVAARTAQWCGDRGIDITSYAKRTGFDK